MMDGTFIIPPLEKIPQPEVADIFRLYGEQYRCTHSLPLSHLKVKHALEVCRTAALGGHLEKCDSCGFERPAYNSCRNRHCPKCQAFVKAKWLDKRTSELLPVKYFHNVFTLPHEINPLALTNKRIIYTLLFKAVSETLLEFGKDPKHRLGGKIGFICVLHTWDQILRDHLHLHCLIPAGALSFDGTAWIHTSGKFLFSVKALSRAFRKRFIDLLKKTYEKRELIFPSKKPFSKPEYVLDYLGRYVHRVAISNNRIISIDNGHSTFWHRDRRHENKKKQMTLTADEFIRRFLLHILPDDFMKVHYFGFLANRCKKEDLALCRQLLCLSPELPQTKKKTCHELMLELTGVDIGLCPCCKKGRMKIVRELPMPHRNYPNKPIVLDSS
jgi:hypothetical protein